MDLIDRQAAIDALRYDRDEIEAYMEECLKQELFSLRVAAKEQMKRIDDDIYILENLPSAQPERLTDDDFETIRIHLSAFKEELCNQHRWEEAEEYQRIINRFMSFANARQERNGRWLPDNNCHYETRYICSECKLPFRVETFMMKPSWRFCPNCGARMESE